MPLQYVVNQLKDYSSFDLVLISDIIKSMSVGPHINSIRCSFARHNQCISPPGVLRLLGFYPLNPEP